MPEIWTTGFGIEVLHKVNEPKEWGMSRVDEVSRQTADICSQFESAANALEAVLKNRDQVNILGVSFRSRR